MNFDVLRNYLVSAQTGSLTKAADLLFLSPQGLNKSITHLEEELGCKLIVRSNQGIGLTENGRIFLDHAKKMLRCYEEMVSDFSTYTSGVKFLSGHRLTLTVSHICLETIVNPMLERNELLEISLFETDALEAFELMGEKNRLFLLDLSPYIIDEAELARTYEVVPIVSAKMGIITRKSLAPKLQRVVPAERVATMPIGVYETKTTGAFFEKIYREHPLENIVFSTKSHSTLVENMLLGKFAFMADSCYWAHMPEHLKRGTDNVIFAEIEGSAPLVFAFVYRKDNPPNQEHRQFIESFIAVYKRMYPFFSISI